MDEIVAFSGWSWETTSGNHDNATSTTTIVFSSSRSVRRILFCCFFSYNLWGVVIDGIWGVPVSLWMIDWYCVCSSVMTVLDSWWAYQSGFFSYIEWSSYACVTLFGCWWICACGDGKKKCITLCSRSWDANDGMWWCYGGSNESWRTSRSSIIIYPIMIMRLMAWVS